MDNIKEAFQKVKQDMDSLTQEVSFLKLNLIETREKMIEICDILKDFNEKLNISTLKAQNTTDSTYNSTVRQEIGGLKHQNIPISTGNQGVPTDRQTNQQTDIYTKNPLEKEPKPLENALEILNSLDALKKELRLKFKRLTEQELLVFSTIYQLEEEKGYADYKSISAKLKLSESSVRDYVQRIIKKGVSVEKKRVNNKIIHLSIALSLKKIASLSTILKLRDL